MFLLALASFNKTQQVLIKERKIEKAKPDIILKLPNTSNYTGSTETWPIQPLVNDGVLTFFLKKN